MSIEALRWALEVGQDMELNPTQRHVLLMLGNRADEVGYLYPSVDWICKRTGHDRRTVQRTLKSLTELQLVRRAIRVDQVDGQTSNAYWLAMTQPGLQFGEEPIGPTKAGIQHGGRHNDAGGGAALCRPPGGTVPPNTQDLDSRTSKAAGHGKPSPVTLCFQVYSQGIKAAYGADYPPSAQANGQLAHVVRKLGAEPAAATVAYYLTQKKPFYVARKHALEVLVNDCATLWLEAQQAAGGRVADTERCAYCERPAAGSANGWKHCREHGTLALSSIGPKQAAEKRALQ